MADMTDVTSTFLQGQLLDRRGRLQSAIAGTRDAGNLVQLLQEVDAALERVKRGTFGICEVCHEPVETARLMADPLVRYCLDHLTAEERTALERDLEMAASLQLGLLPQPETRLDGWEIAYAYRPLGPVSGDYCDLVVEESPERGFFFFVGDVSGKGVTASMLTSQLHAIFRSLVARRLAVAELVGQASRIFCESALSPYFATLVGGRGAASGSLEMANAGHCPPLVIRRQTVTRLEPSGAPLGMFSNGDYRAERVELDPGDKILIYTDGLSEARNDEGGEYGEERLLEGLDRRKHLGARALVDGCLEDLAGFLDGAALGDDLTVMAIRRAAQA
jgi:phosphoserine phosphatase RsbU/P